MFQSVTDFLMDDYHFTCLSSWSIHSKTNAASAAQQMTACFAKENAYQSA
jgi:hypothetical protein